MLRRIVLLLLKKMPATIAITLATTEALKKFLKKLEFFRVRPNTMQQESKLHICIVILSKYLMKIVIKISILNAVQYCCQLLVEIVTLMVVAHVLLVVVQIIRH